MAGHLTQRQLEGGDRLPGAPGAGEQVAVDVEQVDVARAAALWATGEKRAYPPIERGSYDAAVLIKVPRVRGVQLHSVSVPGYANATLVGTALLRAATGADSPADAVEWIHVHETWMASDG